MGPDEYLAHLRLDAAAMLGAADRAPAATVPSCPDWDVVALVRHSAGVHHWVAHILRSRALERPVAGFRRDAPTGWVPVREWYLEGVREVVDALERVDPDEPVWNWRDRAPAPARFWHRRMAHETAVHRWDAQQAVGDPGTIDPALALDGIDELLGFVPTWLAERPLSGLHGSLRLEATDTGDALTIELAPSRITVAWGRSEPAMSPGSPVPADATIRAGAADVLLWLVSRRGAGEPGLSVSGDPTVVAAWSAVSFE